MNKPNNPSQTYDDDIAELFDAQNLEVPAILDDQIRSMARAELEQESVLLNSRPSLTSLYAPVFATAAVMVLAVALVPMLINQSDVPATWHAPSPSSAIEPMVAAPEESVSSSDMLSSESGGLSAEERADVAAFETQEQEMMVVDADVNSRLLEAKSKKSAATSIEAPVTVRAESESDREVIVTATKGGSAGALEEDDDGNAGALQISAKQAAKTAPSEFASAAAAVRTPSAVSTHTAPNSVVSESLSIERSGLAIEAGSEDGFRMSREGWLDELSRLFKADEHQTFLDELALFKKQYPTFDLSEHLPADALKLGSSD
ncbi:MAG: hypothetical protein V3U65_17380 [Granulosicoccaceae bacterium]